MSTPYLAVILGVIIFAWLGAARSLSQQFETAMQPLVEDESAEDSASPELTTLAPVVVEDESAEDSASPELTPLASVVVEASPAASPSVKGGEGATAGATELIEKVEDTLPMEIIGEQPTNTNEKGIGI